MSARVRDRHAQAGEVAFLLEPDLKEGRGGLRDVHALRWAQAARSILWDTDHASLDAAYETLLSVRVELHRRTGRPGDQLLLQEQDGVADALGYRDADTLMGSVALAARTIAWTTDDAWHRIDSSLVGPLARARRRRDPRRRPAPAGRRGRHRRRRRHRGRPRARPARPPPRPPGAARSSTAARSPGWRSRSPTRRPRGPTRSAARSSTCCWPARPPSSLLEALDQQGVWERYVPEWPSVRSQAAAQRLPPLHRRPAPVGDRRRQPPRSPAASAGPTCSCWPALFHDIGKGGPGDHTDNGVAMLAEIGPRMGLDADDAAVLVGARAATTCCWPTWPPAATSTTPPRSTPWPRRSAAASVLGLLAALTEADSLATGPAAWSDWKAGLVRAAGRPRRPRPRWRPGGRRRRRVPQRRAAGAAGRGRADAAGRGRPADRRGPRPARPVQPGGRRAVAARPRRARRRGRRRAGLGHRGVPGPVQLRADDHAGTG